jgi:3-oxoadipate enol-lactonase
MSSFATTPSGTRIAYATAGRPWRPALILTHSLGSDHHMWDAQIQSLKAQFFIVAIDNIGHGDSDAPAGDYTIEQMGDAVLAVAAGAELDQFHFCGLSVGGITGQWLAVHHADRLLSLAVCNTAARIGSPELWDERIEVARGQGMAGLVDGVVARWFSDDFAERNPEQYHATRATLAATDPVGYAGVCAALRDGDLRGAVGSIATRTLVIAGNRDLATPVEQGIWLHEQIVGSRFVELDAAHLSNLDCEPQFTAALSGFLAEMAD